MLEEFTKMSFIVAVILWANVAANFAHASGYSDTAIIIDKDGNITYVDDAINKLDKAIKELKKQKNNLTTIEKGIKTFRKMIDEVVIRGNYERNNDI